MKHFIGHCENLPAYLCMKTLWILHLPPIYNLAVCLLCILEFHKGITQPLWLWVAKGTG